MWKVGMFHMVKNNHEVLQTRIASRGLKLILSMTFKPTQSGSQFRVETEIILLYIVGEKSRYKDLITVNTY